MRILTYKRTHTGDPDGRRVFGVNDCMGRVRAYEYDAVIGVGGIGAEPREYGIAGKITWVGVNPKVLPGTVKSPQIAFEYFVLFDAHGPELHSLAPNLARRMYQGKVRYLLKSYSRSEQWEAEGIVQWAKEAIAAGGDVGTNNHLVVCSQNACERADAIVVTPDSALVQTRKCRPSRGNC
ncbi:hypothetical protein GCM10007907_29540 [Chitinimonas prasina]|uniref:Uncharacterized protein n=1 Tax=Chitinimonas prasina TaxID=1434937 RepID=A0ABQ5YJQ4_9NEIS|nr:hypothetical protein GCM10007907_29540 [Chitinimonas prasina]